MSSRQGLGPLQRRAVDIGCNCGKNKTPLGARTAATQSGQGSSPAPSPGTKTTTDTANERNRQAQTGRTQSFSLELPSARTPLRFGSRLEAEAARVRAGGVGTIRST